MTDVSPDLATPEDTIDLELPDELLSALQRGDESTFARIVLVWSPTLVRTATALTGDRGRAEELVKATWLRLLAEITTFRPPPRLRTWVCGLMVREASRAPTGAPEPSPPGPAVEPGRFLPPGDPEWPGHWALPPAPWPALEDVRPATRGVGSVLRAALECLPQSERVVIGLRDVAGCEVDEIGQIVGRPPGEVRALLNHGRAEVRDRLERHFATAQPA